MTEQHEDSGKIILDDHIGLSNDVNFSEERSCKIVTDVMKKIEDLLLPIYGNKARFNLIIHDSLGLSRLSSTKYTSDGIISLEAYNFASAIDRQFANLITYVGRRVDAKAFDGTTSSMLFTTYLIKYLYTNRVNVCIGGQQEYYHEVAKEIVDVFNHVRNELKKFVIEDISKEELRKVLLTTTKDNHELTDILVDICHEMPADVESYVFRDDSPVETDYKFKACEKEEDYSFSITSMDKTTFNNALKTSYTAEDPYVLILTEPVRIEYKAKLVRVLLDLINKIGTNTPIVIISAMNQYAHASSAINEVKVTLNDANLEISLVEYTPLEPFLRDKVTELEMFNLMTNTRSLKHYDLACKEDDNPEAYFIKPKKIIIDGYYIKFFDSYPTKGKYFHAYLGDTDFPAYNKFYNVLIEEKEKVETSNKRELLEVDLKGIRYLIKNFTAYKVPYVRLGGRTNDIPAGRDVFDDAKGVVMSAKRHGVVVDGFLKVQAILIKLKDKELYSAGTQGFIKGMISSIDNMLGIVIRANRIDSSMKDTEPSFLLDVLLNRVCDDDTLEYTDITDIIPKDLDLYLLYKNRSTDPEVYQTYALYDELFKCLVEIFPKLIKTQRVLVSNSVVMGRKNKE